MASEGHNMEPEDAAARRAVAPSMGSIFIVPVSSIFRLAARMLPLVGAGPNHDHTHRPRSPGLATMSRRQPWEAWTAA